MRIRRFTAQDMTAALRQVRDTLGPDAVILEAKGPAGGPDSDGEVSVLAAVDRHPAARPASGLVAEAPALPAPAVPATPTSQDTLLQLTDQIATAQRAGVRIRGDRQAEESRSVLQRGRLTAQPHRAQAAPVGWDGSRRRDVASRDIARELGSMSSASPVSRALPAPSASSVSRALPASFVSSAQAPAPAAPAEIAGAEGLRDEIQRLHGRLNYLSRLIASDHFSAIPIPLRELYLNLVEAEVDSNLAFAILRDLAQQEPPDMITGPRLDSLHARLLGIMPGGQSISHSPGPRVAILLGPPGSGKTTVAAALAAGCLAIGRRPGLLSLDSLRAGGTDRLAHYGRLLDVPFAAVYHPEELAEVAATGLGDCDVVLVDTPGMVAGEGESADLVRTFQERLVAPETHLVLAATAKVRDAAGALDFFRPFGLTSLIFTKLDVTQSHGGLLSLALKARLPVSHLNWGRQILRDLRDSSPEELIGLALRPCLNTVWPEPPPAATHPSPRCVPTRTAPAADFEEVLR